MTGSGNGIDLSLDKPLLLLQCFSDIQMDNPHWIDNNANEALVFHSTICTQGRGGKTLKIQISCLTQCGSYRTM